MSKRGTGRGSSKVTRSLDVRKADTKALVVNAVDGAPDDVFAQSYWAGGVLDGASKPAIIEPSYKPGQLYTLAVQNNTLSQCIEVMEVNIDGTGHSIDIIDGGEENEAEKQVLEDFFKEPYPGKTMISIRRALRRDMEITGNAYLEVIRNPSDEIVLINNVEALTTRLIRYDEPVVVTKTVIRAGKPLNVTMQARERRFIQDVNGVKTYFKQFGASRDLDRYTGVWAPAGTRLPAEKRATEILYMTVNKEPKTPYGTPRWINQMPSVLGSRKAEEHNLEFFDSGGLPPVLIMIQGGTLGDTVREDLINHLSGRGGSHRAAVVEAVSTSGSLDSAGSVQVKVERFGAERMQDAMFQAYDRNTEEHVRTAFRLPPLFTGKTGEYSFATAYASYLIAEAQVFWPERDEFDGIINNNICKSLGAENYKFRSLPLTIVDIDQQMKTIELSMDKLIDGQQAVDKLNEIVGLGLEYQEPPKPPQTDSTGLPDAQPDPQQDKPIIDTRQQAGVGAGLDAGDKGLSIKGDALDLDAIADEWVAGIDSHGGGDTSNLISVVKSMTNTESRRFNALVAAKLIAESSYDPEGLGELCGCASHLALNHDD